jgi:hypothetical protein
MSDGALNQLCRLVHLLGNTHREVQERLLNPLLIRGGSPPLENSGDPKHPSYPAVSDRIKDARRYPNHNNVDVALKFLPRVVDEEGRIRAEFVYARSAGAKPSEHTRDFAEFLNSDTSDEAILFRMAKFYKKEAPSEFAPNQERKGDPIGPISRDSLLSLLRSVDQRRKRR